MSTEVTGAPTAPESTPIEAEVVEVSTPSESVESDSKASSDIDSDPAESFEAWKARKERENTSKEEKNDKKTEKSSAPDKKPDEKTAKEEKTAEDTPKPAKVKVKDKEYTVEELEKTMAEADNAIVEFNKINDQAKQLIDILKNKPGDILDRLDVNRDAIEKWYYEKFIEPDLLTPAQKQSKAEKMELEARRKADDERKAKEDEQARENLRQQYQKEWENRIHGALDEARLPKSDLTVSRMAFHIRNEQNNGNSNIKLSDIAAKVRNDLIELQKSTILSMEPDKLAETLGEETMTKLRKMDTEKFKQNKFENKNPPTKPRETKKDTKKRKYSNPYQLLEDL